MVSINNCIVVAESFEATSYYPECYLTSVYFQKATKLLLAPKNDS